MCVLALAQRGTHTPLHIHTRPHKEYDREPTRKLDIQNKDSVCV